METFSKNHGLVVSIYGLNARKTVIFIRCIIIIFHYVRFFHRYIILEEQLGFCFFSVGALQSYIVLKGFPGIKRV